MLKRDGQLCKYTVPGFVGKLTPAEFDAYNEAFGAIQDEFAALEIIRDNLRELMDNPSVFTIPDDYVPQKHVAVPNLDWGQTRLNVRSRLLKLNHSQVLLCERTTNEGRQFAVVERYQDESPYAQAQENTRVLVVSDDPLKAVQDYIAKAEHTLRFMASNMVARAQTVVWERYSTLSPSRVVRAISDRCAQAAGESPNEAQAQILERRLSQRQAMGQRHSTGQGI